ncbi:MAG: hypothetical protein SV186_01310 [Candidatus Nanohaloarchaea archaeon]|nr:hypothetical protein [Candidatus Nanohaloarchaea archaeon]
MPGDDDENLKEWISELERGPSEGDIERYMDGGQQDEDFNVESREYQQYKSEEVRAGEKSWYERFVNRTSFFSYTFEDMEEDHRQAIRLLDWDIEAEDVAPSATMLMLMLFPVSFVMMLTSFPMLLKLFFVIIPFAGFYYILKYPNLRAQQKVVKSSEDLILSILYMVVYMRSTPNLEGAVAFSAQRLQGPVSRDFNEILWKLDMRVYNTIDEGLRDYMDRWKPYNRGFIEALSLLESAKTAPSNDKRLEILNESVNNLLDYTKSQMNEFARQMRLPVMVLHGVGILLPVLGIILFPMIASFMGGSGMGFYLFFLYDIIIPLVVFAIMRNLLVGRPVSFSSAAGQADFGHGGKFPVGVFGTTYYVPLYVFTVPLFLLMMSWPVPHYFHAFFGGGTIPISVSNVTLLREMMLVLGISVPAGLHLYLGYKSTVSRQNTIREMEEEFPEILFELGNQLDKGMPIERAIDTAAQKRQSLNIADLFRLISRNIKEQGMDFKQAVFDQRSGAIQTYPSQLISTIMEIISESIKKGPEVTSRSILSISNYLKNIRDTQEKLEEVLDETVSSIKFLGYIVAPVISGIAVGMGSVISQAFYAIGQTVKNQSIGNATAGAGGGGGAAGGVGGGLTGGASGVLTLFNIKSSIPPGVLQAIVGIYLIELALLIGTLYVRLEVGNNPARRNIAIGQMLLVMTIVYTVTVFIITAIFGGIISGIGVS